MTYCLEELESMKYRRIFVEQENTIDIETDPRYLIYAENTFA